MVLVEVVLDVISHRHLRGRDEADANVAKFAEQVGERTHGAALSQISDHSNAEVAEPPEFFADGVKVEQGLGGVLADAVAAIDDGDAGNRGGARGGAHFAVAQHNHVGIAVEDSYRVLEGLALRNRRELAGVFGRDHAPPQAQHRRFKRKARARRGLVKERGHNAAVILASTAAPSDLFHPIGQLKKRLNRLEVELLGFDDVVELRGSLRTAFPLLRSG